MVTRPLWPPLRLGKTNRISSAAVMGTFTSSTKRAIVSAAICRDKFAQTDKTMLSSTSSWCAKSATERDSNYYSPIWAETITVSLSIMVESDLNFRFVSVIQPLTRLKPQKGCTDDSWFWWMENNMCLLHLFCEGMNIDLRTGPLTCFICDVG